MPQPLGLLGHSDRRWALLSIIKGLFFFPLGTSLSGRRRGPAVHLYTPPQDALEWEEGRRVFAGAGAKAVTGGWKIGCGARPGGCMAVVGQLAAVKSSWNEMDRHPEGGGATHPTPPQSGCADVSSPATEGSRPHTHTYRPFMGPHTPRGLPRTSLPLDPCFFQRLVAVGQSALWRFGLGSVSLTAPHRRAARVVLVMQNM